MNTVERTLEIMISILLNVIKYNCVWTHIIRIKYTLNIEYSSYFLSNKDFLAYF